MRTFSSLWEDAAAAVAHRPATHPGYRREEFPLSFTFVLLSLMRTRPYVHSSFPFKAAFEMAVWLNAEGPLQS